MWWCLLFFYINPQHFIPLVPYVCISIFVPYFSLLGLLAKQGGNSFPSFLLFSFTLVGLSSFLFGLIALYFGFWLPLPSCSCSPGAGLGDVCGRLCLLSWLTPLCGGSGPLCSCVCLPCGAAQPGMQPGPGHWIWAAAQEKWLISFLVQLTSLFQTFSYWKYVSVK